MRRLSRPGSVLLGEFDDPNFDDVNTATAQAGITCTVCHVITTVNNTRGNGAYTIEEPDHYPFAFSDNPVLKWVNLTLVKAKPEMHKKTFMKPVIRTAEFCSVCHKVGHSLCLESLQGFRARAGPLQQLPPLGRFRAWSAEASTIRRSPSRTAPSVTWTCWPPTTSGPGISTARGRADPQPPLSGSQHGAADVSGRSETARRQTSFLDDKKVRVDVFALREEGKIDGQFLGPLRPTLPELKQGRKYLVEAVVRTLNVGHPLTQGTVDSNEIWVELIARQSDRVIGRCGGIGPDGAVDPYSHFINVYMLDRKGNRIDRRNPQDIFVPLYNKQIPPERARSFTSASIFPPMSTARSRSRPGSTTASSIASTWTTSSATGRGPGCRWS